ncbi:uncharacterized protein LOC106769372 isoform X1 [Vigna radiata var. radiata]|uniref:Uncharacterized protein LOC106769372 isoform X1 n=1 Tax=Vigna radiata var. radiata TaxID=3916 RepID=A0A1S3UWJ6_VIGRR|nr:uncharacterized protein LOC106769372 isoform X1 [Vigna radiata var. radiata]
MLVANSFDLWRKDAFFSAAEEVQESADVMESAYRAWLREKRERSTPAELNELCRELQTALGTAKWQLEEFEKAVRLSYRHHGDDNSSARHRQFISAIESQITQVEEALRESFIEQGKQPLRWVHLDEEERDDLAAFLSGTCQTIKSTTDDESMEGTATKISSLQQKQVKKEDKNVDINTFCNRDLSASEKSSKDVISANKDANYVIEIKADAVSRSNDEIVSQTDRTSTRKTWNPPNYGALKIVIADEDEPRDNTPRTVDATPKEKGFKNLSWKQKFEEYPQAMRVVRMFNQRFGRTGICQSQRQFQRPFHPRYGCSVQVTLVLMLTIFLLVPFVLYSS